jgi:hypothetical protein
MPVVGPVQVHHVHYKCTVCFIEVTRRDGPASQAAAEEDCREVIYIDHDHLHRVGNAEPPASANE